MSQVVTIVTEVSEVVEIEDQQTVEVINVGDQAVEVIEIGNGLSAYQIAVLHGYVGTEAQWIASVGGLAEVADDTSPSLGGDLTLGSYNIIGQLENNTFILDGGLL
mgnify:CR=1 FL=1